MMIKIASWNVNSIRVRLDHVLQWLAEQKPDVLALQETKSQEKNFPVEPLKAAGYNVLFTGQKTYNGMALLSKSSLTDVVDQLPGTDNEQKRFLAGSLGSIHIINVYVPNGQSLESDRYQYKLSWLESLRNYLHNALLTHSGVIVLGDFNIAPEDCDVYDPKVWQNRILVSTPEREAFRALLAVGYHDSFRLFPQEGNNYSWWDYRAAAFRRDLGLRIDHILISDSLRAVCQNSTIDKEPRAWLRPSDHTPVFAEFELEPGEFN